MSHAAFYYSTNTFQVMISSHERIFLSILGSEIFTGDKSGASVSQAAISTMNYIFQAKNKPQVNQMINKNKLQLVMEGTGVIRTIPRGKENSTKSKLHLQFLTGIHKDSLKNMCQKLPVKSRIDRFERDDRYGQVSFSSVPNWRAFLRFSR
jgi:hypothetical protein